MDKDFVVVLNFAKIMYSTFYENPLPHETQRLNGSQLPEVVFNSYLLEYQDKPLFVLQFRALFIYNFITDLIRGIELCLHLYYDY